MALIHISLCLQCCVFILNALYLVFTVGKCCIFFFDGLLMILLHFVYKLLSNPWQHHITTMLSEVFCFWLLTWKYQLVHPFPIDVIVIFSRIPWPIHEVRFRNELCQLPLVSVIIPTTKTLYNISVLSGFAIFQCPAYFPSNCPRLFMDGHKA